MKRINPADIIISISIILLKLVQMGLHVRLQTARPRETFGAQGTTVRPHASMGSHVRLQITRAVKPSEAYEAFERLLSSVNLSMHDQNRALPEAFVAHGAAERPLSGVNALVLLHILMAPEYFSAVWTGKATAFGNTQVLCLINSYP